CCSNAPVRPRTRASERFFCLQRRRPLSSALFPYTTLFRSCTRPCTRAATRRWPPRCCSHCSLAAASGSASSSRPRRATRSSRPRSEEHTSELQSLRHLVCRLLLEKKKAHQPPSHIPRRGGR